MRKRVDENAPKRSRTTFSLAALHVEDGAFGWAVETVFGPKNQFGASSKAARLEAEKREFRGNETGLYFRGIATGGAQECVYAENKRDAQILDGAKSRSTRRTSTRKNNAVENDVKR